MIMADIKKVADSPLILRTETGAMREKGVAGSKDSKFPAMFSLIPARGLRRLAETCGEGFLKYGQGNWLNGFKETDLLDHCMAHLNMYMTGDRSEDHIAHGVWNLFVLMHLQETEPEGSELLNLVPQTSRIEHQSSKQQS
jgi:hypothetical protein